MNSRISDGKFSMFFYGCLYKIELVWCFFRARVQVNLRWYFSKYNIIFHCIRLSKILAPLHTIVSPLNGGEKYQKKSFSKILFFFQFCYEELIQYRPPQMKLNSIDPIFDRDYYCYLKKVPIIWGQFSPGIILFSIIGQMCRSPPLASLMPYREKWYMYVMANQPLNPRTIPYYFGLFCFNT